MPTQTHTALPPAEELYNALMWDIEPELTTQILPWLSEMYADETPEQSEARGAWYREAFELFMERNAAFMAAFKKYLSTVKKSVVKEAEKESGKDDDDHLSDIEHSMQEA